ncbi:HNH endonuclease [Chryseobacterium sp. 6424]|nr:HNH endonuclease [Chryseobacterium sp. 6424]
MLLIKEKAEQKIKIVAGIRWQVFKRDNWKCVSCGKSSFDDVILHIDHIIPRSLGGKDDYENFQTLCSECNIGKSNKDTTNLRKYNNASS